MTKRRRGLIPLLSLLLAVEMAVPQGINVFAEETAAEEVQETVEETVSEEAPEVTEETVSEDTPEITEETVSEEAPVIIEESGSENTDEVTEETAAEEAEAEEEVTAEEPEENPIEETEQESEPEEEQQEGTEIYVSLSPANAELKVGESMTFEALVNGTEEELVIAWSTDNDAVAKVDETGTVTAVGEGIASVRASVLEGTVYADAVILVKSDAEARVIFEEECYEVETGETITVPYELSAESEEIVWTVNNEDVVSIDVGEGEVSVTGLMGGTALVTATADGISSTFGVVVLKFEEEIYEETERLEASGDKPVTGSYSVKYMQTSARDLATALNYYRWSSAQLSTITYDYTIEKYAMQRAAEIVMSFSLTRPDGSSWDTVFDKTQYGNSVQQNILYAYDGSLSNAQQALSKVLADNTQRSRSLRTSTKSFGVAHVNYNGIDYWVMLFSDWPAKNTAQTTPVDWNQTATVKVRGDLYSTFSFTSSSSTVKVKVNQSVNVPSINGKVRVTLGGQQTDIAVTGYSVAWTVSNTNYATITSGKVKAKGTPTNDPTVNLFLTATVTMNGHKYTVKVPLKIIMPVSGVDLTPTTASIDLGKTLQLTATVKPANATDKTVTWSSSNSKIASVSSKGLVTAKKGGKATITVKTNDGGYKKTCEITVIVHPTNIAFEFSELTMTEGMSETLVPVFTPADTTDKKVTYTSSDSSYVAIAADGTVTAKKITETDKPVTITVKTNDGGLTADLKVTVKDKDHVAAPKAFYYYEDYEFELWNDVENEVEKGTRIKLTCDTRDAVIYYTTDGSNPTTSSSKYSSFIVYPGGNVTVKAMAVKPSQMYNSEISVFEITEGEEATWEIMEEDLEKLMGDDGKYHIPTGIWAAGIPENTLYSREKITFADFRVYYGHHLLELKEDYTVAYKNNVNVCPEGNKACEITYQDDGSYKPASGTKVAYIKITGKGNYKGTVSIPFEIEPMAVSEENGFSYQSEIYLPLGKKALKPVPVILWKGKKLKNKTDYEIAYSKDAEGTQILTDGITEAGDYYIIVSGVKNYTYGTPRLAVPVHVKDEAVLLSKASVKIADVEYTGSPVDPETLDITVKVSGKELVKGTDYVIESILPENAAEIGKVSLTIKAAEGSSYLGEKTASFKITGKALSKAKLFCLGSSVIYKGSAYQLEDLFVSNPKRPDLNEVSLLFGDEKLVEGTDYTVDIVGINKGSGKVTFTGIGHYTGTITKKFTIKAKPITKDDLYIYVSDVFFTKSGAVPFVYVFLKTSADDPAGEEFSEGLYGRYLSEGYDYTVKCFNNKKIYTDETYKTSKPPSVSIIMKGNYKGTVANNNFLITEEEISWFDMEAADIVYAKNKKGSQYYVKPVIYDYEGKKLTLNKDYTLSYCYAQDARVNGSSTVNRAYGTPIRANDTPEPNTVISVTATGIGSYYGTLKTEYKVVAKADNISSVKVTIDYQNGKNKYFEYTGLQIIPEAENLTVKLGKTELVYGVDYEIQSLKNNVKAGKATMILHGIGNYGGTKKVTFNIGKHSLILDIGNVLRNLLGL